MSLRAVHNQPSTVNSMERVFIAMTGGAMLAVLLTILAPNPAVAIDCGKNKSHNLFMGTRVPGDEMLFMDTPTKYAKLIGSVSADLDTGNLGRRISYIEVIDAFTDGDGGCAFLRNGGVGNMNAAFYFESQRGIGLHFTVKVFGH